MGGSGGMFPLMTPSPPKGANLPSLEEAARIVDFVLRCEVKEISGRVEDGATTVDSLRDLLAVTIAVVGATEHMYTVVGREHPDQWDSMARSAAKFMDGYVVGTLGEGDPELKRAVSRQRRRKLSARAGTLRLVESERSKRARWAAVTLPQDSPIPISNEVADGLAEETNAAEERIYDHLNAEPSEDPLVLAGQIVGLLTAAESLLALLPSSKVAAFCVQLAQMKVAARQ